MAITAGDYLLWKLMAGRLPSAPRVIEIGEANWYGDVPLVTLQSDYGVVPRDNNLFTLARQYYAAVLGYRGIAAIDLSGQEGALAYDLNRKISDALPQFDVLINTGTIEHVFDQRQVWQTCHEITAPGGVMVHVAPVAGWFNHGFYTIQPTLIADLGAANGYTLEAIVCTANEQAKETSLAEAMRGNDSTGNVMLHWAWRKGDRNTIFKTPMQSYYAGTLGEDGERQWRAR